MDAQTIAQLTLERHGLTLSHDRHPVEMGNGYMVSLPGYEIRVALPVVISAAQGDRRAVIVVDSIIGLLSDLAFDFGAYIGTWEDSEAGQVCFDLSEHVQSSVYAAALGRKRGQKAIYDIARGQDFTL